MNTLTHSALIATLNAHKGACIVGISALTDSKARKTGNPHGTIFKDIRAVGFVGADYQSAVQRQGERVGATEASEFKAKPLPWGVWVEGMEGKVIAHKGGHYLRTQTTPGQRKRQPAKLIGYRNDKGEFLPHAEVKPFLPIAKASERQAAVGVGGEDGTQSEQIMVRTYAFDSIRKVRVNGQTFKLVKG